MKEENRQSEFTRKLLLKGLAYKNGAYIQLNSYGKLAMKMGFDHYFELEELEQKWNSAKFRKKYWFTNILISMLIVFLFTIYTFFYLYYINRV